MENEKQQMRKKNYELENENRYSTHIIVYYNFHKNHYNFI